MEILEDLFTWLKALNPAVLVGLVGAYAVLTLAFRLLRRRGQLAALAPTFGLQPLAEASSSIGLLEPGLTGVFSGLKVHLTIQQAHWGNRPSAFRVNVSLRLRVSPLLSPDLHAERERGVTGLVRSINLPVEPVGDEALDRALRFSSLGAGDQEVLLLPEIRRTLVELVETSDTARFADGELQLRVVTTFNVNRVAETMLTRAQAFAEALTSEEARGMRADGPEQTPRSA